MVFFVCFLEIFFGCLENFSCFLCIYVSWIDWDVNNGGIKVWLILDLMNGKYRYSI